MGERVKAAEARCKETEAACKRARETLTEAQRVHGEACRELIAARIEADADLPQVTVKRFGFVDEQWVVRRISKTSIWASAPGDTGKPIRFAVGQLGNAFEHGSWHLSEDRRYIPREEALKVLGVDNG